jgi:hypothetical protein
MATVAKRTKEAHVSRQVALLRPAGPGGLAHVRLVVGKDAADYLVRRVPSQIGGAGFEFVKQGEVREGEDGRHFVLLAGGHSTCDCRGHLRWGKECRHLFGARVLLSRGWL